MTFRRLGSLAAAELLCRMALAQTPAATVHGINFSPYLNGQDPSLGQQISSTQITARLQIIAPYTKWVRSFSSTHGLENIPAIARQMGLKVAANAWISKDTAQNAIEINNLIANANAGLVDIAIVGSEAIQRNDATESQLLAYMNQVRSAIPAHIPVTTADTWANLLAHPNLIAASDIVFANFYPYWEGSSIDTAVCTLISQYQRLVTAAGTRPVAVSETGWPSAGSSVGAAVPSAANANLYALRYLTWAGANNIQSFYFGAFDEAWKVASEGSQGAYWGIWDALGVLKPGRDAYFNGQTAPLTCDSPIPGPVAVQFTYVPPLGSNDWLQMQATGVQPSAYVLATYIRVGGVWWTKPTFMQPTVALNSDGTAAVQIVSGGSDNQATDIAVFMIPAGSVPPTANGGGLPSPAGAVASRQVSRTARSISGTIADGLNNPIAGAVISDPVLGTATSAPDGKYSFYNIAAGGTAVLTVTHPGYSFSPATFAIPAGNLIVNFTGVPGPVVTPATLGSGTVGSAYAAQLTAAGGVPPYGGWTLATGSLPPGLVLGGSTGTIAGIPSSATGSPFAFGVTVTDSAGKISAVQTFSIAVSAPAVPLLSISKTADAGTVAAGAAIGYTITVSNSNAPGTGVATGVTLNDPLAAGTAINWSIGPAYTGQGTCAILGAIGSQTLGCNFGTLAPGATVSVHVTSATTASSCGVYPNTATLSAAGGISLPASATTNVRCGNTRIGTIANGIWHFDVNGDGTASDRSFGWSVPGATYVTGDWNGDGRTKAGFYFEGLWYLDYDGNGSFNPALDKVYGFGWLDPNAIPVVGDWNGDGRSKVGIYYQAQGLWYLDLNGNGVWEGPATDRLITWWAGPGSIPKTADWNGDGRTKVGFYYQGLWYLDYDGNGAFGAADKVYGFGWADPNAIPIVGDWDGDGRAKVGIYYQAQGLWFLDQNGNGAWDGTSADRTFGWWGGAGSSPLLGDWNGDGRTKAGFFKSGLWYLDYNGNGLYEPGTDKLYGWGQAGDMPIAGRW